MPPTDWILLAFAVLGASPLVLAPLLIVWESVIRPMRIPAAEIDRLARELIVQHGHAALYMARSHEERAAHYGEMFEQAKWRRVRKHLENLRQMR